MYKMYEIFHTFKNYKDRFFTIEYRKNEAFYSIKSQYYNIMENLISSMNREKFLEIAGTMYDMHTANDTCCLIDINPIVDGTIKFGTLIGRNMRAINSFSTALKSILKRNSTDFNSVKICLTVDELLENWVENSEVAYIDVIDIYVIFNNKKVMADLIEEIIISGTGTQDKTNSSFNPCQVIKIGISNVFYIIFNGRYDKNIVKKVKQVLTDTLGKHEIDVYSNGKVTTFSIEDLKGDSHNNIRFRKFMSAIKDDVELVSKLEEPITKYGDNGGVKHIICCDNKEVNNVLKELGLSEIINYISEKYHDRSVNVFNVFNSGNSIINSNGASMNMGNITIGKADSVSEAIEYIKNHNPSGKMVSEYHGEYHKATVGKLGTKALSSLMKTMGHDSKRKGSGFFWI
jgi:hypothetical protein